MIGYLRLERGKSKSALSTPNPIALNLEGVKSLYPKYVINKNIKWALLSKEKAPDLEEKGLIRI